MNFIDFPQSNLNLAENQPEYQTVPVFVDYKQMMNPATGEPVNVPWSMTCVNGLSDEEINEIVRTRKIYYRQMLFGNQFQPIFLSTKDPFEPGNEDHWPKM